MLSLINIEKDLNTIKKKPIQKKILLSVLIPVSIILIVDIVLMLYFLLRKPNKNDSDEIIEPSINTMF